jgi:hypothetical protein
MTRYGVWFRTGSIQSKQEQLSLTVTRLARAMTTDALFQISNKVFQMAFALGHR